MPCSLHPASLGARKPLQIPLECLLAQLLWNEGTHVLPVLCTWLLAYYILTCFTKSSGSRKKTNSRSQSSSLYSLQSSGSPWPLSLSQLILFTNISFCYTLGVSQRERDHYEPERPHRANITFDYGPTTGFTLNQLVLWNTGSKVSAEICCLASSISPLGNVLFLSTGFLAWV